MRYRDLKQDRIDHYLAADAMIKAARKAGKDLAGDEREQFDAHIAGMNEADRQMDAHEKEMTHLEERLI